MSKLILGLLVALPLLAAVAVAGVWGYRNFVEKPTQNLESEPQPAEEEQTTPAAERKVYNNKKYEYKVRYPADFNLHSTGYSPGPPYKVRFANYPISDSVSKYVYFEIEATPMTMPTPLAQFPEVLDLSSKGYTKTELTIGGEQAIKLVKAQGGISAAVFLIHRVKPPTKLEVGDYSFRLVLMSANTSLGKAYLEEFNLFVDSLEFY